MPHKESCTDRGELGINTETGEDFCMNCGEVIKPDEDSVIIQDKFLSEKPKKRESYDEIFDRLIKPILRQYWMKHQIKFVTPTTAGYFYIYLRVNYLDFKDLKKYDKDIGKHGWYLISIVKQTAGFALRCKT